MTLLPSWRRAGYGDSHRTIEEIYLVLAGQITIKLGDATALGPRDAVPYRARDPARGA